ncbi:MAG: methyltransferase domain-containing protein [Candidatus Limnocylindrales bacterium]
MSPGLDPTAVALARLYDVDLLDDPCDLELYLALAARAGGQILELGVGSGRLAVPLAAAGWSVTGVDLDPAMLARARARAVAAGPDVAARLELVAGDARTLRLADRFRLVFVALNSLLLFGDRAGQAAAIQSLADHLEPGGIGVVDVWLPDADDLARYDGRILLEYARSDPETGRTVVKTGAALHDAASQSIQLTTIYDEGGQGEPPARWLRSDRIRLVGADELRAAAEAAGLAVEVVAGGYDLEPIGPGSERAVLVAVRP